MWGRLRRGEGTPKRRILLVAVPLALVAACGATDDGLDIPEPERVTISTAGPEDFEDLDPTPSPEVDPGPTPSPVPPPRLATLTSAAGVQRGVTAAFCWSELIAGPAACYEAEEGTPDPLEVREGEEIVLEIDTDIPPNDESVRPFRGSRSGFPVQQIQPAPTTDLVVELPEGRWSLDVCAAWHGRGQPICWFFRLDVVAEVTESPPSES
jgi:hypothetical protein